MTFALYIYLVSLVAVTLCLSGITLHIVIDLNNIVTKKLSKLADPPIPFEDDDEEDDFIQGGATKVQAVK